MAIKNDTGLEARICEGNPKEAQFLIRTVKIEVAGQRTPFHQNTLFFLVDGNLVHEHRFNPENANGDIRQRPPFAYAYQFPFYPDQDRGGICLYTKNGHFIHEKNGVFVGVSVFDFANGKSNIIPFDKYNP